MEQPDLIDCPHCGHRFAFGGEVEGSPEEEAHESPEKEKRERKSFGEALRERKKRHG